MELDFPARMPAPAEAPAELLKGVSLPPAQVLKARDYFLVYESEDDIRNLVPDFQMLNKLPDFGNNFPVIGSWVIGGQPAGMIGRIDRRKRVSHH